MDHLIHQIGGASVAYLAGVLRIGFGTYFETSMLAGLLCIAAARMVEGTPDEDHAPRASAILAGAHRPLAGIVKAFSDLVISGS